jgi:predicted RecA/RadA family phage recombinase
LDYNLRSTFGKVPERRPSSSEEMADAIVRVMRFLNDLSEKTGKEFTSVARSRKSAGTVMVHTGASAGRGGSGGSPLTVRTVDRGVSVPGVGIIELKQNDGFKLTSPTGGVARVGAEIPTVIISVVASEDLDAFVAVTSGAELADSTNVAHWGRVIGLTLGAIAADSSGAIAKEGRVENPAWSWSTGDVLYLNGTSLSTTAPSTGFSQVIGVALNATTVVIKLGVPILL